MDAREVLKHAGVDHPAITPVVLTEAEQTARDELDDKAQNGRKWQEERDRVLDR
jgi:hypothetical protein